MPPGAYSFEKFGSPTLRSSCLTRRTRSSNPHLKTPSPRKSFDPTRMSSQKRRKSEQKPKKEEKIVEKMEEEDEAEAESEELADRIARVATSDNEGSSTSSENVVKKESKSSRRSFHPAAEIYTKKLYRQVAEGYDMDADSDTEQPGISSRAIISDNWRPEYSGGTQELAHPEALPRMIVQEDDFYLEPKENFVLSSKYIACNQNVTYYDVRSHEIGETRDPFHYEVTAHDTVFIKKLNEERRLANGEEYMTLELFVRIIKALERETFIQMHNHLLDSIHVVYIRPPEDGGEDAECDVCRIRECDESDEMVFCDMCNTCVHMVCAGIDVLPDPSVPWKCAKCSYAGTPCPPCILCPALGGSMTYNEEKTEWAHHSCALFMPEIIFENEELRAPMTDFDMIAEERFTQLCIVCDTRQGACVTCSWPDCEETYHVCCALRAGMTVRIQEVPNDPEHNVTRITYCHRHSQPQEIPIDSQWLQFRRPWLARFENIFYLMVAYEKLAIDLNLEEVIVSDVYEYWKQKRMEHGSPLIPHLHDYVHIEPSITRVAEKAAANLELALDKAGISKGTLPTLDSKANRFFRPAALMVTELRQLNLKRAGAAILKDLELTKLTEMREIQKKEAIDAECHAIKLAFGMLLNGETSSQLILDTMKIPKVEIRKAQVPTAFADFCAKLATIKRKTPVKRHHQLETIHQKSPLRPRNHHIETPTKRRLTSPSGAQNSIQATSPSANTRRATAKPTTRRLDWNSNSGSLTTSSPEDVVIAALVTPPPSPLPNLNSQ